MDIATAFIIGSIAGFVFGFLVCRNNYKWVKNVEAKAVTKAKKAVNKL